MGLKHPRQEPTHEFPRGKLFKKLSKCARIKRRILLHICMYVWWSILLFLFCSGVSWSELKERSRTLPSAGQSCSRRTTFDLLQSCGPRKRVILPQCAKNHCFGTGGTQDLTAASEKKTEMKDYNTMTHEETNIWRAAETPLPWDGETHIKRTHTHEFHFSFCVLWKHSFVFPHLRAWLDLKIQPWM